MPSIEGLTEGAAVLRKELSRAFGEFEVIYGFYDYKMQWFMVVSDQMTGISFHELGMSYDAALTEAKRLTEDLLR